MKIRGLTFIFILTLTVTFWINFGDYKFNTIWFLSDKALKLESMIDNFCLSYIAGYFFYFLNVYLAERDDKKSILPFVGFRTRQIIDSNHQLIRILYKDVKIKYAYPKKEDFKELLSNENLNQIKIYNFEHLTFPEFLEMNRKKTLKHINFILNTGDKVDDELKSILFSLKESLFLKKGFVVNNFLDKDLVFEKYFIELEKLKNYFNGNLVKYYALRFPRHYRSNVLKKL